MLGRFFHHITLPIHELIYGRYGRLARLNKPVGIYLTLLPTLWAVALACNDWGKIAIYSVLMVLGAIAARSAGCIVNDLWDMKHDAKVERTKNRPLASGEVSQVEAYRLLAVYGVLALLILLMLPTTSIIFGLLAIPMIIIYPLLKRITFYPQVFLGFVFNLGVFIGWFAVNPLFSFSVIALYIASIAWAVGYDTIYGHQDRHDDDKHGMKSLSLKIGDLTPGFVWATYKIMIIALVVAGMTTGMNLAFYLIGGLASYYLYWQSATLDISNPIDCADKFRSNIHIGVMIYIAILCGKL